MDVSYYFCFLVKGHFTCKSMEIGIIEGPVTLIFKHFRHIVTFSNSN